jgi:Pectate lyase superfamily protein
MSNPFPRSFCCFAAILSWAGAAAADVIVVQEQTQAAIQTALNRVRPPGTVVLPPGRYQIDGTLFVRIDQLTLQGAGFDQTVLFRQIDGTTSSLLRSTGHAQVRVTGIRFEGVSILDPDGQELSNGREVGVLLEDAVDFRVDHCSFSHTGFAGVRTNGSSSGVVDHCTFEEQFKRAVGTDGYGVVVYGIDALEGEPFGSARATFIEDSFFRKCRHAAAANKGARYVFRYNHVVENVVAHAVDAHGHEYGSSVGTEWIDVHDNLIENPSYQGPPCAADSAACYAVHIRGGQGVIWNNSFISYNQGIQLRQDTDQPTGPAYLWGNSLVINEGSQSRCPNDETSPMLCARGTMGIPIFFLSPPDDYVPFPYPHPLVTD